MVTESVSFMTSPMTTPQVSSARAVTVRKVLELSFFNAQDPCCLMVSINGATPIAGWFISWKIPSINV